MFDEMAMREKECMGLNCEVHVFDEMHEKEPNSMLEDAVAKETNMKEFVSEDENKTWDQGKNEVFPDGITLKNSLDAMEEQNYHVEDVGGTGDNVVASSTNGTVTSHKIVDKPKVKWCDELEDSYLDKSDSGKKAISIKVPSIIDDCQAPSDDGVPERKEALEHHPAGSASHEKPSTIPAYEDESREDPTSVTEKDDELEGFYTWIEQVAPTLVPLLKFYFQEEVLDQIGDCLGTLIKTFKASFFPFFDELFVYITPMWGKGRTVEERRIAICIFDDVVEQCPEASLKYYDTCLPFLLEACNDENADVRQVVVYGIGVYAEFGGSMFQPFIGESLSRLNNVNRYLEALHADNIMAYDNDVPALGKICLFYRDSIDVALIIPAWLSCLPIKSDKIEARSVHDQLGSMVEWSENVVWSMLQKLKVTMKGDEKELMGKALMKRVMQTWFPTVDALLEMMISHLLSLSREQRYRMENLFEGPLHDFYADAIRNHDPEGPLVFYVSKMIPASDKGRFFAFVRVFAGKVSTGLEVRIMGPKYVPGRKKDRESHLHSMLQRVESNFKEAICDFSKDSGEERGMVWDPGIKFLVSDMDHISISQ